MGLASKKRAPSVLIRLRRFSVLVMVLGLSFVAIVLLLALLIRQASGWLDRFQIPVSLLAGFIGLAVLSFVDLGWGPISQSETPRRMPMLASEIRESLGSWPGVLISIVFACMLLHPTHAATRRTSSRSVVRQGVMVWIIVLGQTMVGLAAVLLVLRPAFELPAAAGVLIETGFAGGHGTAAAMGEVYASSAIGFDVGRDLGLLMATAGLVYGLVGGIFWVNLGVRHGWCSNAERQPPTEAMEDTTFHRPDAGKKTAEDDGKTQWPADKMLIQWVLIALAFAIGVGLQSILVGVVDLVTENVPVTADDAADATLKQKVSLPGMVGSFPTFIFTLFGGWIVRRLIGVMGQSHWIDELEIRRVSALSMDLLIVAAVTTLNLAIANALMVPLSILFLVGAAWSTACLLIAARWILPREYWFELGLINFGMSTGTTATGFVLLRMVDADMQTPAAQDYALAAPLSAPFIGGGILTVAMPLVILPVVPLALVVVLIAVLVVGTALVAARTRG